MITLSDIHELNERNKIEEIRFFDLGIFEHTIAPFPVRREASDRVNQYMSVSSTCAPRLHRLQCLDFSATIDQGSTTFHYNGTPVTVTADQLKSLKTEIGSGHFGRVFLLEIDEPVRMSIAVKVSLSLSPHLLRLLFTSSESRCRKMDMFLISLQCIPIGGKPDDRQAIYTELTALEKMRSTPSPYVVGSYRALVDSVSVLSLFSSDSGVLLMHPVFLRFSELCVHLDGTYDHDCRHVLPGDASDNSDTIETHRSIRSALCS